MEHRLQRLEELQAFAERESQTLSAELHRAFELIGTLTARIDALEGRTTQLENPIRTPEDERPPHSTGPRT